MLFEHFPYTNYHDINLAWLLNEMKQLHDFVVTSINDFNQRLSKQEAALAAEIAERNAADNDIRKLLSSNYEALNAKIRNLEYKHDNDIIKLNYLLGKNYTALKLYIDTQIADVLKKIATLPGKQCVYNYIRQEYTCLQTVLSDYYAFLRDRAFTAEWFDEQGFTCDELDAIGMTALQWDMFGELYLRNARQNWPWMTYDHHNGNRIPVQQSINELWQYNQDGLTCAEWDAMTYTAAEFDAAGYTAYQIDWTRDPEALDKGPGSGEGGTSLEY